MIDIDTNNVNRIRIAFPSAVTISSSLTDATGGKKCSINSSAVEGTNVFTFTGIAYQGLYAMLTKTYRKSPTRSSNFAIKNLNASYKFALIPRLQVNFKYFDIENYAKLSGIVANPTYNEFYVEYFDPTQPVANNPVCYPMYFEPQEQTKIFSAGGYLKGVIDYKVSAIGTMSNR